MYEAEIRVGVEMVSLVRGFAPFDRVQGIRVVDRLRRLGAIDRLDWLGDVGVFGRFRRLRAGAPLIRVAAVDHVLPVTQGGARLRVGLAAHAVEAPPTPALITAVSIVPTAVRNSRGAGGVGACVLVEIWSDVVCPWCYIGKRRFEAALENFEHKDEVEVRWRSFELDPNAPFRRPGRMAEHLSRKYGMTVEQAEERLESMNRLAAAEGLSYDLARTQAGNTFDAHRLIHLGYDKDSETGAAVKEALLKAYFVDLESISEPDTLQRVGKSAGLDPDELTNVLESDRFAEEVRADELAARELGCTGVPFFVFDRAFSVPGAQDPATILSVMKRAWDRSHPIGVIAPPSSMCTDDSCGV